MSKSESSRIKLSQSRISEKVSALPPSGIRKFFDLLSSMEGVISLGVGEPDFVTPWYIREAAIYSLEKGYTMYTSNKGTPELRAALSKDLESRYGLTYDPDDEILITVGVSEGLDLAARAILNPGDEVIMPDPCYVAYPAAISLAGGIPVQVSTSVENDFEITADDIESRITQRTKAILIGYPCNPTGAVLPKEELTKIAELAKRYNLLVISDEVYCRLVYGVEHTCLATLPGMRERTILLNGFSKAYAMTGWRLGYAAGPADIIAVMGKIHQHTMLSPSSISQKAALQALKSGDDDVKRMVAEYDKRRRVMFKGMNEIGLECHEPRGAFYVFPSVKVTGMTSDEFTEKLLLEEKVIVLPGNLFGKQGEGFVRCAYATSMSDIEEALRRMARFVERHRIKAQP